MPNKNYQSSSQNTAPNPEKKIKMVGKRIFLSAKKPKDTWLHRLICSDRIFTPTEYKYVDIECNYKHKICLQIKG